MAAANPALRERPGRCVDNLQSAWWLSSVSLDDERSQRAVLLPLRVLAAKAKIGLELEVARHSHSAAKVQVRILGKTLSE